MCLLTIYWHFEKIKGPSLLIVKKIIFTRHQNDLTALCRIRPAYPLNPMNTVLLVCFSWFTFIAALWMIEWRLPRTSMSSSYPPPITVAHGIPLLRAICITATSRSNNPITGQHFCTTSGICQSNFYKLWHLKKEWRPGITWDEFSICHHDGEKKTNNFLAFDSDCVAGLI